VVRGIEIWRPVVSYTKVWMIMGDLRKSEQIGIFGVLFWCILIRFETYASYVKFRTFDQFRKKFSVDHAKAVMDKD
jgi:hypothetical protein